MVTTLYLIRHGATEGDGKPRYKGTLDVPLSEEGARQMEAAGAFMGKLVGNLGKGLSALYCSSLSRAQRSAEIVSRPLGVSPVVVPELRERDFGLWEGMSFDEITEQYPLEFEAWAKDPLRFSPMGGESTLEVRDRVVGKVDELMARHRGEALAVVAHGGVNRVVLCHFMGLPLEHIFRIEQDLGCVNIVELHEGYPVVRLLNGFPGAF